MEIEKLALVVKKYILASTDIKFKPSISYIVEKSLSISALRMLVEKELPSVNDKIRMFYIVFFLIEGDDIEVAKYKAFNELYYLILEEVGEKDYDMEDCEECYHGKIDCSTCDSGRMECYECNGDGEIDDGDGDTMTCDECDGEGYVDCDECYGEGTYSCYECDGEGEIASEEEYVSMNTEYWIFYGDDTRRKLNEESEKGIAGLYFEPYDILDEKKGSVYLLRTDDESEKIEIDEFEEDAPYHDVEGKYKIEYLYDLSDYEIGSGAFRITRLGRSWTIR